MDKYKTWLFDCDGVILDSNRIKTEAFFDSAIKYGKEYAKKLVELHISTGGVSRFEKMRQFVYEIIKTCDDKEVDYLIREYGRICFEKLKNSNITPGFVNFIRQNDCKKFVISGGREDEVVSIFKHKKIDIYFNGIYGSPRTKENILDDISEDIDFPAVYVGDSKYDFIASNYIGSDFIFMYEFSEFQGWEEYFKDRNVMCIKNIIDIGIIK